MRLLLVRHGETDWNATGRIQGSNDIPLNDTGRKQAERLHRRLATVFIDAAYSSDLARAAETAHIVLGADSHPLRSTVPIRVTPALREISYGEWEGRTREELEADGCGPWLQAWVKGAPCDTPEGGESREEVDARVDHFLSCIFPRHAGQTVLVVSHGGTLRLLIARLRGQPVSGWGDVRQGNTALSEVLLRPGGPAEFVRVNDVEHLST